METIRSTGRVPFGMLGGTRLQRLTSTKNTQNTVTAVIEGQKSSPSVLSKRKQEDLYDNDDSENIDPSHLLSPKKAKTNAPSSAFTFSKPSTHFVLKADNTTATTYRPTLTPRASKHSTINTPRTAPSGRTPPRKRHGKGRLSTPFSRVNPPSLSTSSTPFSIDAALSGSVPSYAPAPPKARQLTAHEKNSWFFEIHEDTPEEELGNLMEFGTQTLDISDDESRLAAKRELEERGKENIPPESLPLDISTAMAPTISVSAPATRADKMEDGPRTPLGELEAKEYYGEGCDETSVFVVRGDDDEALTELSAIDAQNIAASSEDRDESPSDAKTNQAAWAEIMARVDEKKQLEPVPATAENVDEFAVEATSREEAPLFDIWESESAKEEAEEAALEQEL